MSCIGSLNPKYKKNCYKKKKTLFISAMCFPPLLNGPAVLMGNLFRKFPKNSYTVLMGNLEHIWWRKDMQSMLDCSYNFSRYPIICYRGSLFRRIRLILRDIFSLWEMFFKGLNIIHKEKIDNIFVVTDHFVDIPALFIHFVTGKKITLWLPDIYYRPDLTGFSKIASGLVEPFMLHAVNTVLVTCEATRLYYKEKYNLSTRVLPHSVDLADYADSKKQKRSLDNTTKITFIGSVNKYNYDNILDMIKVVSEHPKLNAEFVIIANNPEILDELCIKYPRLTCFGASREEIPLILQKADILFLPLSFKEHEAIIRTSSPGKLPEYLIAGCPILVYAPPSSYYARYTKEMGFGLVVSKPDRRLLYDAVNKLKHDTVFREQLIVNAKKTAIEHHDSEKVSEMLQRILGIC